MKNIAIMLKPASSLCNMRCSYCFYADIANLRQVESFGVMSRGTMEAVLKNIRAGLEPGDSVNFAFQGGEPTVAGLDYFKAFSAIANSWRPEIRVSYALQTNATLLDEDWCAWLKENNCLVGVSLDILPDCHDAFRLDAAGKGTYRRVLDAVELLKKHGVEFNVLCTLTAQAARHPQQMWKKLCQLDLQYVQFTPCLDELEKPGESRYALTPRRFASFYNALFRLWDADFRQNKYRSIKFFDDVVNLMTYGVPTSCGMNGPCQPQLIVEADGSVYPCDFYCLDEYRLGSLVTQTLDEIQKAPNNARFRGRPHTQPKKCASCPFAAFCGGGCKRMQREICCSGEDDYCGYRDFLETNGARLREISLEQRRYASGRW